MALAGGYLDLDTFPGSWIWQNTSGKGEMRASCGGDVFMDSESDGQ